MARENSLLPMALSMMVSGAKMSSTEKVFMTGKMAPNTKATGSEATKVDTEFLLIS